MDSIHDFFTKIFNNEDLIDPVKYAGYVSLQCQQQSPVIFPMDDMPKQGKSKRTKNGYTLKHIQRQPDLWKASFSPDMFISVDDDLDSQEFTEITASINGLLLLNNAIIPKGIPIRNNRMMACILQSVITDDDHKDLPLAVIRKKIRQDYSVGFGNMQFFMVMRYGKILPVFFKYSEQGMKKALEHMDPDSSALYLCRADEYSGLTASRIIVRKNNLPAELPGDLSALQSKWLKGTEYEKLTEIYAQIIPYDNFKFAVDNFLQQSMEIRDILQNVINQYLPDIHAYAQTESRKNLTKQWGIYFAEHSFLIHLASYTDNDWIGGDGEILLDWKDIPPYRRRKAFLWIARYLIHHHMFLYLICRECPEE